MIQPIVEGHGEIEAFPVLLRRLAVELGTPGFPFGRPIRRHRSDLLNEARFRTGIRLAKKTGCGAILALFDADYDCPKTVAARVLPWAVAEAAPLPCAFVLANREYEAWFLAGLDLLAADPTRRLRPDAVPPGDPESVGDAKGYIADRRLDDRYIEVLDQPRFSALFDMVVAHERCRSFRKLVTSVSALLAACGANPSAWPAAKPANDA
jgi:uncharacterized protein DUF4276